MKKFIAGAVLLLVLAGCDVRYIANPTDDKRKPDCVQIERKEGKSEQNVGLYCRKDPTR